MRGPRSAAGRSRRKCRRKFFSGHSKESSPHSLEEFVQSLRPGECQGGDWHDQQPGSTRITFQNINGVPTNPKLLTQEQLSKWLQDEPVGIALFAETNCHWPSLREGSTWRDRLRKISPGGYYTARLLPTIAIKTALVQLQVSSGVVRQSQHLAKYLTQPKNTGVTRLVLGDGHSFVCVEN